MRKLFLYPIAILVIALHANPSLASTWTVKPDGTGDFPTIQAAVDAAGAFDVIMLTPGTFTGVGNRDVDLKGKQITVTSQAGAASTIIDCQGLGRGFICVSHEFQTTVISNLTITNGAAETGAAIHAHQAEPTIEDNILTGNIALYNGGAIHVYGTVNNGGAIARNTITNNHTTDVTGRGGGLYISSTDHVIEDNIIQNNQTVDGGGIWMIGNNGNTIRRNDVSGNTATGQGGGIFLSGYAPLIAENIVYGNDAGEQGGGIYLDGSGALVDDCVIAGNTSAFIGAGIYFHQGTNPVLRNATVVGNIGNGAVIAYGNALSIERCIIANNTGSGMFCFAGATASVSCTDLYGNSSNTICGTNAGYNFSSDPLFCGAVAGDYLLSSGSPAAPANSPCALLVGARPVCTPTAVGTTPARASLDNYPNPFNPSTTIRYEFVGASGRVSLVVYDVNGARVRTLLDEWRSAGGGEVQWDGRDDHGNAVGSGVYFCRIVAPGVDTSRRMVLLK